MLARRDFPPAYHTWNHLWHAPHGRRSRFNWLLGDGALAARWRGPFAWQPNNDTRSFEYPWIHEQISARGKALRILEIGGGLSGLQFVLASEGHRVVNVDPGLEAKGKGWALDPNLHRRLARTYGAPVALEPTTIERATLKANSFDVILSVSALEHFAAEDLEAFSDAVPRLLQPSGVVILTVDLFVDLLPFSTRPSNAFGTNINLQTLLSRAGLKLIYGDPAELHGFPGFDARKILERLPEYLLGTGYPSLTQCVVAELAEKRELPNR